MAKNEYKEELEAIFTLVEDISSRVDALQKSHDIVLDKLNVVLDRQKPIHLEHTVMANGVEQCIKAMPAREFFAKKSISNQP